MAVSNLLTLWQLAATIMGETGTKVIKTVTSVTLPLELTFVQIYDQVRLTALRSGNWDFAKRRAPLRLAPTKDYRGKTHVWSDDWRYVYAPPVDSVKFLRFGQDLPEAGLVHSFIRQRLPIFYKRTTVSVTATSQYAFASHGETPNFYRGWMRAKFFDEQLDDFVVVDRDKENGAAEFDFVEEKDNTTILDSGQPKYDPGAAHTIDLAPGEAAGVFDFGTADYPATLMLEHATGDPYADPGGVTQDKWADHILTNLTEAVGVYLVDMVNPGAWPEEFQNVVAGALARRAALVHAKSSKLIKRLDESFAEDTSIAVGNLTSDDGFVHGGIISGAEKARL